MKKKKSAKKRLKPKARRQQKAHAKSSSRAKSSPRAKRSPRVISAVDLTRNRTGLDESTQSGDDQGLSDYPGADSESVKELADEGQYLEAEAVEGVENAPDADVGPVKTSEVPEDDVPEEYLVDDNRDSQS